MDYFKASLAVIALAFLAAALAYNALPEKIASHWNAEGKPDGFSGKSFVFFLPGISLAMLLALWVVPSIDPLGENIKKFRKAYDAFVFVLVAFFAYLEGVSIAFNFGWVSEFNLVFAPAFAVLLYCAGMLLEKTKRSWFIGVRTPWTLSSDRVWSKTNSLGAKLFKACAVLYLIAALLAPKQAIYALLALVGVAALVPVVYSYLEWRKEKRKVRKAP